ncbi:MAG: SDR family oxidoreductase [Clostridia bacterium]|nr:SDR family oxidoreductase [Clostridia bacterium]
MKITLITGATGGLGKEFAKLYAADGNNLLLVATNEAKLAALKAELLERFPVEIDCFQADLSKEEEYKAVFAYAQEKGYFVNNLVNNAGFGDRTDFKEMNVEKQLDMISVNCSSLVYFTRVFLDDMLKNDEGHIINVGSIAGFVSGPYMSTYHATKAFVLSFGESVSYEIRKTKVKLLTLCPGTFESNFVTTAKYEYAFSQRKPMSAEKVAKIGYQASKKGKRVVVAGFGNKLTVFAPRFFPRSLVAFFSAKTAKKGD